MLNDKYVEDELKPLVDELVEVIGGLPEVDMMMAEGRPSFFFVDKTCFLTVKNVSCLNPFTRPNEELKYLSKMLVLKQNL